jgi:hypothetical protein
MARNNRAPGWALCVSIPKFLTFLVEAEVLYTSFRPTLASYREGFPKENHQQYTRAPKVPLGNSFIGLKVVFCIIT